MRRFLLAAIPPIVITVLFLVVPGLKARPWNAVRIAGAIVAFTGYALMLTGRIQLGESFSIGPKATGLVNHGLYSRIRNPMYVFADVMLLGLIIVFELPWILLMLAGVAVLQMWQAGRERKVLQAKFGQAYVDYRDHTWF